MVANTDKEVLRNFDMVLTWGSTWKSHSSFHTTQKPGGYLIGSGYTKFDPNQILFSDAITFDWGCLNPKTWGKLTTRPSKSALSKNEEHRPQQLSESVEDLVIDHEITLYFWWIYPLVNVYITMERSTISQTIKSRHKWQNLGYVGQSPNFLTSKTE